MGRFELASQTIRQALAVIERLPAGSRWMLCATDDDTGEVDPDNPGGTLSSLYVALYGPVSEFEDRTGVLLGPRTGFDDWYARRGLLEIIVEKDEAKHD